MRLLVVFSFSIAICGSLVWADATLRSPVESPETKVSMANFLTELIALKKYFVSDDTFNDPKNAGDIAAHLKTFTQVIKQADHDRTLNQENFRFTRQVLQNHISETERVFRLGNKSYARWMMTSTVSICMSCHTQIPSTSRSFTDFKNPKMFSSDFDEAEFLFATRAFEQGSAIYDHLITSYPKPRTRPEQIETALERQVAYYSRIKRDPSGALTKFRTYQKNKDLPVFAQKNLASWIQQFGDWSKQRSFDPRSATENEIESFAEKYMDLNSTLMMEASNPRLVSYLRVSGVLYEYLQTHPGTKITPKVLYWLSICDRSVNKGFFNSQADLYLRQCILEYPADPIAKKCYSAYEEETALGYSGSGGTHLPPEVVTDLKELKKILDNNGKVPLQGH
jgi:hypothetical protein